MASHFQTTTVLAPDARDLNWPVKSLGKLDGKIKDEPHVAKIVFAPGLVLDLLNRRDIRIFPDGLDYIVWSNNYWVGCPAAGSVPEPTGFLLLALGGLALIRRKP